MIDKEDKILKLVEARNKVKTQDIVRLLGVSRQYAKVLINNLITIDKLMKIGSTRSAFYVFPKYAAEHLEMLPTKIKKFLNNKNLEEHLVLDDIENRFPLLLKLKENIRAIFTYAFSEMLNNAIEHSNSQNIEVEIKIQKNKVSFNVIDFGIGVFRNVMQKKKLLLFGAGHVGKAIVKHSTGLDFDITIVDCREGIFNDWTFEGLQKITAPFTQILPTLSYDNSTFIVIATYDHSIDREILAFCIKKPHFYLGMIGSKTKVTRTKEMFVSEGIATKEELEKVDMPIGIDINAKTSDEIAISIFAKLIKEKNK